MKILTLSAGLAAFTTLACIASTAAADPGHGVGSDMMLDEVPLRPGVTADIHVRIYDNPRSECHGKAVFAVHGATGAASNWGPLADSIFELQQGDKPVCRIAAVDLPGHGESSLPDGMLFGDLMLHDYVTSVRRTLERLEDLGIRTRTLFGHSQGGLVVQLLQQELVDEGTNMREELGVKHVVLMAPAGPRALPWAFAESGTAGAAISPFVTFTPELGVHLDLPPAYWPLLVFSTVSGTIVSNAPSTAEIEENGWVSKEPIATLAELLGSPPFERPEVDAGIFAPSSGTELDVVGFAQDPIILASESEALHAYLTGEQDTSRGFTLVPGDDAVHGVIISNPDSVVEALDGRVSLP